MIIAPLTRHLAVCSQAEVQSFLNRDRDFWHVLSIRDARRSQLSIIGARSIHPVHFDDVIDMQTETQNVVIAPEQAEAMWGYIRQTEPEALLIHCVAGLSRSTAVATAMIAHALLEAGTPNDQVSTETVERLLTVRPPAAPNPIVLRRVLDVVVPPEQSLQLTDAVCGEPRVASNRFLQ